MQSGEHEQLYGQEASQRPLYYLLMSMVWSALDPGDFADYFQPNPLVLKGYPERLGNRNVIFYRQPYPPDLRGTSLTLYVIRLRTLGMASVTVAAVYQSARTVMPEQPGFALLATAPTAFNPDVHFHLDIGQQRCAGDDIRVAGLLAGFADAAAWLPNAPQHRPRALHRIGDLVQAERSGPGARRRAGRLLAALANGGRRGFPILVGTIALACLLLTGWWFLRNISLYGELTGTGAMLDHFGRRTMSLPRLLLDEFEGVRISYWGLFGAFSILTHRLHYLLMDALSLIGVIGLILFMAKNRRHVFLLSVVGFLTPFLAFGGAMLIWWTLQSYREHGAPALPLRNFDQHPAGAWFARPSHPRPASRRADVRLQHRRALPVYHPAIRSPAAVGAPPRKGYQRFGPLGRYFPCGL